MRHEQYKGLLSTLACLATAAGVGWVLSVGLAPIVLPGEPGSFIPQASSHTYHFGRHLDLCDLRDLSLEPRTSSSSCPPLRYFAGRDFPTFLSVLILSLPVVDLTLIEICFPVLVLPLLFAQLRLLVCSDRALTLSVCCCTRQVCLSALCLFWLLLAPNHDLTLSVWFFFSRRI